MINEVEYNLRIEKFKKINRTKSNTTNNGRGVTLTLLIGRVYPDNEFPIDSRVTCLKMIRQLFNMAIDELLLNGSVNISEFLEFYINDTRERSYRNPFTLNEFVSSRKKAYIKKSFVDKDYVSDLNFKNKFSAYLVEEYGFTESAANRFYTIIINSIKTELIFGKYLKVTDLGGFLISKKSKSDDFSKPESIDKLTFKESTSLKKRIHNNEKQI